MSNDLYGNDFVWANELVNGYTRPILHNSPHEMLSEIREAHNALIAKRKLNLIL